MRITAFVLLLLPIFSPLSSKAQSGHLFIQNFPPPDYRTVSNNVSSPQNFDLIQDDRGVLYMMNTSVLLEFDVHQWRNVKGTDNMRGVRRLAKDDKGRIYFGGRDGMLGYLAVDSSGQVYFDTLTSKLPERYREASFRQTFYVGEAITFVSDSNLFIWKNLSFTIVPTGDEIQKSFSINDQLYLILASKGLSVFKGGEISNVSSSEHVRDLRITGIVPLDTGKSNINWWLLSDKQGIYHLTNSSITNVSTPLDQLTDKRYSCGLRINDSTFAIGTYANGIFILDKKGNIKKTVNKQSGLLDDQVDELYYDHEGGLWAALVRGAARIEYPSPVTYFDYANGFGGTINAILKDKDDLWVGTNYGLFHLNISTSDKFTKEPDFTYTWCIKKIGDEIWIGDNSGLFIYKDHSFSLVGNDPTYDILASNYFPGKIYTGIGFGIKAYSKQNPTRKEEGLINRLGYGVLSMAEANDGTLWVTGDSISRIQFQGQFSLSPQVHTFSKEEGADMGTMQVVEAYKIQNKILLGSFKGLYHYDESIKKITPFKEYGEQFANQSREAFELTEDKTGGIWLGSETVNGRLTFTNGGCTWDTMAFMRIPRGLSTWSIFVDEQNNVWIGTDDGLFYLDQSIKKNYLVPFNTLIRNVRTKSDMLFFGANFDSLFNIGFSQPSSLKKEFSFSDNDIAFEFAAPSFSSTERIVYSYQLQGKNEAWSPWSDETVKEFTNLGEGHYVFKVKAKNLYGAESKEASFEFTIRAPWYGTWWAYLIYAIAIFLLVRIIIQLNQHRLINEKRFLAKKVAERTEQISRQKQIIETQMEKVERKSLELEETLATLKRTQNQLLLSEKLASVGQLTAGVAHEINNPINFVTANINPLKKNFEALKKLLHKMDNLKNDNDFHAHLREIESLKKEIDFDYTIEESEKLLSGIEEGSRRTAAIVKGLRQFSRIDEDVKKKANINEGIESTLVLLQNKMKFQNIEAGLSLGNIPDIYCYPGQLNQVFMNLFTNAIDAIGESSTVNTPSGERKIFITTSADQKNVKVSVLDTGPGMREEVKQKIFDPFFTTKDVGKGTGLGLSISYGIIEKHQGTIEVKSEIGKGTEFIILLPV